MSRAKSLAGSQPASSPLQKYAVPVLLVFLTLVLCVSYVARPAYVFDETYYFAFSNEVAAWFENPSLDDAAVGKAFYQGNFHPPLPLYLMVVSTRVFGGDMQDFLLAVRLATVFEFAALVLVVYVFVRRSCNAAAAAFAVALTLLSPRLFAHSLMATYDMPMALAWLTTTFAFYKAMTSTRWAAASGLIFGLALLTKENAFLLPLALWPWGIYFHRRKCLPAIAAMCVIGPLVLYAGWPWLWLHPVSNLARYVADKFVHGSLAADVLGAGSASWRQVNPTLYFGRVNPVGVPWHYPFVMFLLTMPLATFAGVVASSRTKCAPDGARPLLALLWWSILVQLAVFAFVSKPYDGVRLFLSVLPLSACIAGMALGAVARRSLRALAVAVLIVAVSPGAEFFLYQPYGMSYFTPLVGGLPGAEKIGMEVTYYGEAVTPAQFAAINRRAHEGQSVAYAPMFKNLPWRMPVEYIRYGYLKLGLNPADPGDDWDYLIFVNRGGSTDASDAVLLESANVIGEKRLLGVMLSQVLERRRPDNQENP